MDSTTQHKEAMQEATDLPPRSPHLVIADEAPIKSVVAKVPIDLQQMTPSAAIQPTIEQSNSGQEVLFLTIEEQQKQVQFSEMQLEHGVDKTSEKLGVHVTKGSVEETTTTLIGVQVTDEGKVEIHEWIFRSLLVFEERLSVEINKCCIVSPDGAVAEDIDQPQYEPSKGEKCYDCLCQAYKCSNLSGFARRGNKSPSMSKMNKFSTESMRKAAALGAKTIAGTVATCLYTITCLGALVKDFSVYGYLLFYLVMLILASISFVNDLVHDDDIKEDDTYHLAQFIIGLLNFIFAVVDASHHTCTHEYKSCKACTKCATATRKRFSQSNPETNESSSSTDDVAAEETNSKKKCRYCNCPDRCAVVFDGVRIILLEMMNYPNLLLSIFELLVQIVAKDGKAEVLTYFKVIVSLLISLLFVYIARWFVLAGSIFSILKIRTGDKEISVRTLTNTNSARFHIVFVLNAIGHTIIQIAMIVAIGARFYHEYDENQKNSATSSYLPSAQLWYMIVFGYVGPFIGVIMFLVTFHFWTQQFPIEFFLDILELLKKPKTLKFSCKEGEKFPDIVENLHFYLDEATLLEDFKKVKDERLERKLMYPFTSPLHVILCLLYSGLLLAFGLCALINGPTSPGWIWFYVVATIFAIFVNGYTCAIAMVWMTIFVIVLVIIALIILACILSGLSSDSNSSTSGARRN